MAMVERVFSGVQPTGNLHLGNYLGAIVNFVKLQETHNCLYCVVDLHALTQPVEVWGGPAELARNTREVTAAFIASGIDPNKHIVFNQSQVSGHAELAWIFNCVARVGWLNRMTPGMSVDRGTPDVSGGRSNGAFDPECAKTRLRRPGRKFFRVERRLGMRSDVLGFWTIAGSLKWPGSAMRYPK